MSEILVVLGEIRAFLQDPQSTMSTAQENLGQSPRNSNRNRSTNRSVLMALLFLVIILLAGVEFSRRQNLYWYDVRQDYRLNFVNQQILQMPVEVSTTGFTVPEIAGEWDTAVLRLRLSSKLTGLWFEPSISIEGEGFSAHQFLERGVSGTRYLSLAGTELKSGDIVRLSGRYLEWDLQTGELLLFRNLSLDDRRILILAPHPDDAEIAAFGLYSDYESFIATITAGNYVDGLYAHLYDSVDQQDSLRGEMRAWDSIAVPLLAGVRSDRVVNLGYSNGSLKQLYQADHQDSGLDRRADILESRHRRGAVTELLGDSPASPGWEGLIADLSVLLESVEPDVIVAPHPALDAASDHQLTTIALIEALDRIADRKSILFLYTNHHVLAEYYPFGPSHSAVSPPPWFDGDMLFGGLYSHPLDEHQQVRKLFALEAMHDLRAAPEYFVGGPTRRFLGRLESAAKQVAADPLGTYSYFRRAVRSNELFFVYQPEEREFLQSFSGEKEGGY